MEKKRSVGVMVFGIIGFFYCLMVLTTWFLEKTNLVNLIIAMLLGFAYFNLLKLRNWARLLLIIPKSIFACILIIADISILLNSPSEIATMIKQRGFQNLVNFIFVHIWIIAFVFFFTRPKVKEQFR